jgi:hypothetical protein
MIRFFWSAASLGAPFKLRKPLPHSGFLLFPRLTTIILRRPNLWAPRTMALETLVKQDNDTDQVTELTK